jgi:hypothetical protein
MDFRWLRNFQIPNATPITTIDTNTKSRGADHF